MSVRGSDPEARLIERAAQDLDLPIRKLDLLSRALTHSSYAHESGLRDNERLEFLGDAILSAAITPLLLRACPQADEGQLSKLRSRLVRTSTLAEVAREIGLGAHLRLGRGEREQGGRQRPTVLADALEAVLGALFLDRGFSACERIVHLWFAERARRYASSVERWNDPCSHLQELVQRDERVTPHYVEIERSGPDHDPRYRMAVHAGPRCLATGEGRSKKAAKRDAARLAIEQLQETP